ncbi:integrase catalytic domain-containing protein [Trichonephila clavipes]|uniref:Integrase catalytic domain-containing protein n=1 Tax=Trichonephila clavipes TaxID=2585209 RepID=A0A8X6VE21_TRICX|nr:integrase catalytic domain-containing protein [Trichonephila clavipes]
MDFLYKGQIKWNSPSTPHFDGLWETGVKSLKYDLKRVIGNSILSHEKFLTLVVEIEAALNYRPICTLSNDPNDVENLTIKRDPNGARTMTTLNPGIYCQQLDHLKLAIDQKWPELAIRRGVVFHQDNSRPYTSAVTRQKLWELGCNVSMHPPFIPDTGTND